MKTTKLSILLAFSLASIQPAIHAQTFSLLHSFGTNGDGQVPNGGVTLCSGLLYGTTFQGDNGNGYDSGTVYSVCPNGSNYTILYSFSGSDGQNPTTAPVVANGWIYGTTYRGGAQNNGLIYGVCTNGTNFSVLHAFDDGPGGKMPQGSLLLVGNTLYGTTSVTGTNGFGTVYSINTDGSRFTVLHSFTNSDGAQPSPGALVLSGSILYGTTETGGANNLGVLYSVCTNGTNFQVLYDFSDGSGANPIGNLLLSGSTLYGTTQGGGSNGLGTVFSFQTGNNVYQQLHVFGSVSDGSIPQSTLVLSGTTLYGTTTGGGSGLGTVFSINTDGSEYAGLYDFPTPSGAQETNATGAEPMGTLLISGSTLYGITTAGGNSGLGTLYSVGIQATTATSPFFDGEIPLPLGWYYLPTMDGSKYAFGYYSPEYFPYIFHMNLGWEYFIDAGDSGHGAYFYDFASGVWFYTAPSQFPYIYDFNRNAWLYYLPEGTDTYSSNPRWFYDFVADKWLNNP